MSDLRVTELDMVSGGALSIGICSAASLAFPEEGLVSG
jgi:hypothetical protein